MAATLNVLALSPYEEDHRSLREIFTHTKWRVFHARKWPEALRILRDQPIALVLCNSEFPEGRWTEFFDRSKAPSRHPGFVVLSPYADDLVWTEVLHRGALDVLAKPFDPVEVLRVTASAARQVMHQTGRKLAVVCTA